MDNVESKNPTDATDALAMSPKNRDKLIAIAEKNKIMTPKTKQQLKFISVISQFELPTVIIGGFAEDALLGGEITREHGDVDILLDRDDVASVKQKLTEAGYAVEEKIEEGSSKPYKLLLSNGGVRFDIGIADKDESGNPYIDVVGKNDQEENVTYRVFLPKDLLVGEDATIESKKVKVAKAENLLYLRYAVEMISRFPTPRQKDIDGERAIRENFFPEEDTRVKIKPRIEILNS